MPSIHARTRINVIVAHASAGCWCQTRARDIKNKTKCVETFASLTISYQRLVLLSAPPRLLFVSVSHPSCFAFSFISGSGLEWSDLLRYHMRGISFFFIFSRSPPKTLPPFATTSAPARDGIAPIEGILAPFKGILAPFEGILAPFRRW